MQGIVTLARNREREGHQLVATNELTRHHMDCPDILNNDHNDIVSAT